MSKLVHDPIPQMPAKRQAQVALLYEPVLQMEPAEMDAWLVENVQSMDDVRALFKKLILALDALKPE